MNEIEFGNLRSLNWLWCIASLALVMLVSAVHLQRLTRRFASVDMLQRVFPRRGVWRNTAGALAGLAVMILLVFCLTDVRWGQVQREVPQQGIEVMFVLDVSRSMLAEDAAPNRLERAKQMIKDAVDEMNGDRVGLTIFAGESRQRIPMTNHYDDFKQALDEVVPEDLDRGGSRLGDAMQTAADGFLKQINDHQAMVILTDGEDQESRPLEIARQLHEDRGIRVFTIGLGDISQGARVPIRSNGRQDYLQYEGQQVWSKLESETLTDIAKATSAAYIPAGTKQVNMSDVYHGYIANIEKTDFGTATIDRLEARYQWFLVPCLCFLLIEIIATTWRPRLARADAQAPESKVLDAESA